MNMQLLSDMATLASKFVTKTQREEITQMIRDAVFSAEEARIRMEAEITSLHQKLDRVLEMEYREEGERITAEIKAEEEAEVEAVAETIAEIVAEKVADEVADNG
jgi:predicted transposase YbfD/YdcC